VLHLIFETAVDFLRKVETAASMKIKKLLTDNGTQFTDRFTSNKKDKDGKSIPTGQHDFDKACSTLKIEHRLIPPRHPQTNGMVERFNGRISEIVQQTRFASAAELDATLNNYAQVYNYHITQNALGHIAPIQALKKWQTMKPELFKILDNNQMVPDMSRVA
jgi:transposase InsO family protein